MKIVILGDGLSGKEIHRITEWDVISRKNCALDIRNVKTYKDIIKPYDIIVNCIGYTKTYIHDDENKKLHWDINYKGLIDLVNECNKQNKKLVHISTDYIYANSCENAKETDTPVGLDNWYTYTKILGDGYVQAVSNNYLLLRTSFKPRPFPWKTAWTDLIGNFDYIDIISDIIVKLINVNAQGIYNVGTDKKSMYDLAIQTVPNCIAINCNLNIPINNVTMNIDKLNHTLNEITCNNSRLS